MSRIGTVLPTAESLAIGDAAAARLERNKLAIAKEAGLTRWPSRIVGGETRYYSADKWYAIVSRKLEVLWFVVCEDGDYTEKACFARMKTPELVATWNMLQIGARAMQVTDDPERNPRHARLIKSELNRRGIQAEDGKKLTR